MAVAAVLVANPPAGGPVDWGQRQFDSFRQYDPGARAGAESIEDRLAVAAGSGRWQNWAVAVEQFESSPVVGTGAGDYRFWWESQRDIDLTVRNAHSLYLEVLGESGIIGLLLVLTPGVATVWAVAAATRKRLPPEVHRRLVTAVAAAAVVALHLAGDWGWQLPAVVLPAVALAAAALKTARREAGSSASLGLPGKVVLAALTIPAIMLVAAPVASTERAQEARALASQGKFVEALSSAEAARELNPQDAATWQLEANILTVLKRPAAADQAFAASAARAPKDWMIFADWAASLLRRGNLPAARAAARRATAPNPREPRPRYLLATAATAQR